MNTQIFLVCEPAAAQKQLEEAGKIIRAGGLVVFPTETVYGLGGDGTNRDAAAKIYAAKGRPSDNPLIIHIADPEDASRYAYTTPLYFALAKAFMPGPLTVIMPKRDNVPDSVTGGLDSVAVRCPSHPVANALIRASGTCIAAPSANLSGKPSPTEASHVVQDLMGKVDAIIDGGACEIGLESTIVKIQADEQGQPYLLLLRPGAVTHDALCCVCPRVDIAPAVAEKLAENERPLSPGMKYRHYAPSAPLILLDGDDADVLAFLQREQRTTRCTVLCYDEEVDHLAQGNIIPVGSKSDLARQANRLFAALREADATDAQIIYAHLPPMQGLGLALYNRMIRAAAHTVLKI